MLVIKMFQSQFITSIRTQLNFCGNSILMPARRRSSTFFKQPSQTYCRSRYACRFVVGINKGTSFFSAKYSQTKHENQVEEKPLNSNLSKAYKESQVKKLFNLARPEVSSVAGAITLLGISSAVTLSVPFLTGKLIDVVQNASGITELQTTLQPVILALSVVFVVGALANMGRIFLLQTSGQRITKRLREKVFSSVIQQEVAFFDKRKTGEIINRLSSDVQLVSSAVTQNISDGLRSLAQVSAGIGMMFFMSSELAQVILTVVPPVTISAIIYGRYLRSITKQTQDTLAQANQVAEETISSLRTVRAFAKEADECQLYTKKMEKVLTIAWKESLARSFFFGVTGLSGNAILLLVLYNGGIMMQGGVISIGDLSAFLLYSGFVAISINGLSNFYSSINKSLGASHRLWELTDRVPAIPLTGAKPGMHPVISALLILGYQDSSLFPPIFFLSFPGLILLVSSVASCFSKTKEFCSQVIKKSLIAMFECSHEDGLVPSIDVPSSDIEFTNVSFAYPTRKEKNIFNDVNLKIEAGKVTAIVGRSGCGKSTIGSLLLRFYEPDHGSITLGGINLSSINPLWLRQNIGTVSQEPVLFSTSIRENIAYGAIDSAHVSLDDIKQAAQKANAYNFINQLPEGFETNVGEKGITLSGGQRQRVAIARALLKNPKILILDEATSALDAESEQLVRDALSRVSVGRTTITIAHRLSTVKDADIILVLGDDGSVVERGTYQELVNTESGIFRQLVEKQTLL